ncbi:hypothetical protein JTE90_002944 [Oedothorax gibbosus]|uniref:Uncharacterized protein n=1 Tax=Oedothorax gibbosus TaxID=931172 RepID=A0AAV6UJI2_9ARAC|nr:hypothetical protein JTE90_002944 [Oedothorax gibbosus]
MAPVKSTPRIPLPYKPQHMFLHPQHQNKKRGPSHSHLCAKKSSTKATSHKRPQFTVPSTLYYAPPPLDGNIMDSTAIQIDSSTSGRVHCVWYQKGEMGDKLGGIVVGDVGFYCVV